MTAISRSIQCTVWRTGKRILTIKNEGKVHIRHFFFFFFLLKKNAADAHRIIYETYGENINH